MIIITTAITKMITTMTMTMTMTMIMITTMTMTMIMTMIDVEILLAASCYRNRGKLRQLCASLVSKATLLNRNK